MKEGIHPDYKQTTITCACGNVIETGSTKENIRVEVCAKCHPFFTAEDGGHRRTGQPLQQEVWFRQIRSGKTRACAGYGIGPFA